MLMSKVIGQRSQDSRIQKTVKSRFHLVFKVHFMLIKLYLTTLIISSAAPVHTGVHIVCIHIFIHSITFIQQQEMTEMTEL